MGHHRGGRRVLGMGILFSGLFLGWSSLATAGCTSSRETDPATSPTLPDPTSPEPGVGSGTDGGPTEPDANTGCARDEDCPNGTCSGGICTPKPAACGGASANVPRCPVGRACVEDTDCESAFCAPGTKTCALPSNTDGVKNGTETDVDCGGAGNPKCAAGLTCVVHGDCASDGCAFDKTCAKAASCTQLEGGQTCGANDGAGKQADCCEAAVVAGFEVDKYQITAGRMRAFVERVGGDVRGFAAGLPANRWNQAYTAELPQSIAEANKQLGPYYGKRSCDTGNQTAPPYNYNGHVYWTPPEVGDTKDFPKEVLDAKALNCVPWWLMMALCAFDGKHLATLDELRAAYTNGSGALPHSQSVYPWGAVGDYATSTQNAYAIQHFAYATPNPPATARTNDGDYIDIAYYIAPPGRRPQGYNATGHADLVGNLLEWVSDRPRQFVWKGSWERHSSEGDLYNAATNQPWSESNGAVWQWGTNIGFGRPDDASDGVASMGYYGIGGRCAR